MVRIAELQGWQRSMQVARERSRWSLADEDVDRHLAHSVEAMFEFLSESEAEPAPLALDPSGEHPLRMAKEVRRDVLRDGRRDLRRLRDVAEDSFGLPDRRLGYWSRVRQRLPWHTVTTATIEPRRLLQAMER
jgi:hypothetical protein